MFNFEKLEVCDSCSRAQTSKPTTKNMKKNLLMAVCAAAIVSGCAAPHSKGARWEYKVMPTRVTESAGIINAAANEGWVLQSASYDPNGTVFVVMKRHKKPQ